MQRRWRGFAAAHLFLHFLVIGPVSRIERTLWINKIVDTRPPFLRILNSCHFRPRTLFASISELGPLQMCDRTVHNFVASSCNLGRLCSSWSYQTGPQVRSSGRAPADIPAGGLPHQDETPAQCSADSGRERDCRNAILRELAHVEVSFGCHRLIEQESFSLSE